MSAEEEREAAEHIARLRSERWAALLADSPLRRAILDLVAATVGREVSQDAGQLALVDTDGALAERILADLERIGREQPPTGLLLPPGFVRSAAFAAHLVQSRSASSRLRAATARFAQANLRLVVAIARRHDHGFMPLQDLIQEGNLGLLRAVDRFDHTLGFRFSTYAGWWIRHAMTKANLYKARTVHVPANTVLACRKLERTRRELERHAREEPTVDELVALTGLSQATVARSTAALLRQTVSLDRPIDGREGPSLSDSLMDDSTEAPGASLEREALAEHLRAAISKLPPIEADVLRKRFGLETGSDRGLTYTEIGREHSVSRERIRQLKEQALQKLRRGLRDAGLL